MTRNGLAGGAGLIAILGMLTAFGPMSIDLYLPGLPAMADELGVSSAAAQQSLSLFFIGLAAGQLVYGPFSDRYGRRPVLVVSILLYLVSSIMCVIAPTLPVLLGGRFLQGLGAAAGPVVARAVIRDVYHGSRAARMLSFVILVMAVAPLVAPLLGGQIVATLGWRGIFAALAGFSVLCLAVVGFALGETNPAQRRSGQRLGPLFTAYATLLRDREALAFLTAGGMAFGALFAYVSSSSFIYIQVYGVSPEAFGGYFALNVMGLVTANVVNGQLVERFGYRRLLRIGATVTLLGSLVLAVTTTTGFGGLAGLAVPLFFAVGNVGLVGANTVTGLLDGYPDNAGGASALFGFFQFGIGALAGALVGVVNISPAVDMAVIMSGCAAVSFTASRYLPQAQTVAEPACVRST
ncbi:Bcr/CflA family multidrug efflux MFS transporter [Arhodomonas sp. AD133]|uniref:Bcr/CflA family multidrug efflux MFS transporter n=1 Tax=Arhodomonas sp. AD133 TaxID=3415009 RepID=UPI003EC07AB4